MLKSVTSSLTCDVNGFATDVSFFFGDVDTKRIGLCHFVNIPNRPHFINEAAIVVGSHVRFYLQQIRSQRKIRSTKIQFLFGCFSFARNTMAVRPNGIMIRLTFTARIELYSQSNVYTLFWIEMSMLSNMNVKWWKNVPISTCVMEKNKNSLILIIKNWCKLKFDIFLCLKNYLIWFNSKMKKICMFSLNEMCIHLNGLGKSLRSIGCVQNLYIVDMIENEKSVTKIGIKTVSMIRLSFSFFYKNFDVEKNSTLYLIKYVCINHINTVLVCLKMFIGIPFGVCNRYLHQSKCMISKVVLCSILRILPVTTDMWALQ